MTTTDARLLFQQLEELEKELRDEKSRVENPRSNITAVRRTIELHRERRARRPGEYRRMSQMDAGRMPADAGLTGAASPHSVANAAIMRSPDRFRWADTGTYRLLEPEGPR